MNLPVILFNYLKTGSYQIAIKVVDNEGLESLETLHLKINGIVHQHGSDIKMGKVSS
ncbi:MAG: hypothetical protein RIT27_1324 [Pseudomonadota bacterium]|jgi:hypothetical protein